MNEPGSVDYDLIVIGGGAAGFFGAITAAEVSPGLRVLILEKAPEVLGKVRISGGGRCNVTHACFDPNELIERYPRGGRSRNTTSQIGTMIIAPSMMLGSAQENPRWVAAMICSGVMPISPSTSPAEILSALSTAPAIRDAIKSLKNPTRKRHTPDRPRLNTHPRIGQLPL